MRIKTYNDIALEDYETALILHSTKRLNPCVRYIQQFVEKSLKHIICINADSADDALLGSHNVPRLAKRVEEILGVSYSTEDYLYFRSLKSLYFTTSYPSDEYEDVDNDFTITILEWAKEFKTTIKSHQESHQPHGGPNEH